MSNVGAKALRIVIDTGEVSAYISVGGVVIPSISLQLPVSPAAKQAIEEKRSWGDTPQAPARAAPLASPLERRLQKTYP